MGAVKDLYMDAASELFEELHRDPTDVEVEDRVRAKVAEVKARLAKEKAR